MSLISRKREQRKHVREEQEKRKMEEERGTHAQNDTPQPGAHTTTNPPGPAGAPVIPVTEEVDQHQQIQQPGASVSSQ